MKQTFTRLSNRLVTLLSMIFNAARKQADYKKLIRHIVVLNKKQSAMEMINEAALCLKETLNYRLFAFVIKKEKGMDIWLDPGMYKKSLEDIILKDFNLTDRKNLNYLNHACYQDVPEEKFNMKNLAFYEFKEGEYCFRIYMLSHINRLDHHDELVRLILQSCSAALLSRQKIENLRAAAVIDPLTGCYNRREFTRQLKRHIASAVRHKNDLSMFMLDLDYFKKINDTHGHLAGDKVLQAVAGLMKKNMRTGDILARYGGEEFIAILPETDKVKAMELADRLRIEISDLSVVYGNDTIKITASFGVSELNRCAEMTKIIQDADTMLYKAKLNGRNTVMPGLIKVISTEASQQKKKSMI